MVKAEEALRNCRVSKPALPARACLAPIMATWYRDIRNRPIRPQGGALGLFVMELWQLRYFVSVCESGSLAKASARLNIAAPAVSRAIKSLEEGLEARLFDRDGRGMHLTEAGKTLLVRATSILRDAELAKQEISATASHFFGLVTIGMTPSVAAMVGKRLITLVREKYPNGTALARELQRVPDRLGTDRRSWFGDCERITTRGTSHHLQIADRGTPVRRRAFRPISERF